MNKWAAAIASMVVYNMLLRFTWPSMSFKKHFVLAYAGNVALATLFHLW